MSMPGSALRLLLFLLSVVSFVNLQACAGELQPNQGQTGDGGPQTGPPPTKFIPGEKVVTKDLGAGLTQVTVNATADDEWIYFSFAKNDKVSPSNPPNSKEWDIAFQRYEVKSNSGISGTGGVSVAYATNKSFDSFSKAPKDGYIEDKDDSDDEDTDPDYVFLADKAWYVYNLRDHTLKPRKRVYFVKDAGGVYYKMEFTGYYDDKGNSGFPQFRWTQIDPPE